MSDGHTFGFITKSQKGVTFANMKARLVDDEDPNKPTNLDSPNFPRVLGRFEELPNPVLGDPGLGKIGRWQFVKMDELETMIEQIIEQYLRDKNWYSKVRCREALWNMYRRLDWWVRNEVPPDQNQYGRVLQMIKDCIHEILEPQTYEDSLVFEEVFNVPGVFSPNFSPSSGWEWIDTITRFEDPNRHGDGGLIVEDKPGTHTLDLNLTLNHDGHIGFDYGALFVPGDSLQFYVNDQLVWSTQESYTQNGAKGKRVELNLSPGAYNFRWVYTASNSSEPQYAWVDVIRVYERKPIAYAGYNDGTLDPGFTYTSGWKIDHEYITAEVSTPGKKECVSRSITLGRSGYVNFKFATNLQPGSYVTLTVNSKEVFRFDKPLKGKRSFRSFRYELEGGTNTLEWCIVNGTSTKVSSYSLDEITFVEVTLKGDKVSYQGVDIPYCPAPYNSHYDYEFFNHFDGSELELITFSMDDLSAVGIKELPGIFRWVSSKEDQEWELIHQIGGDEKQGNENILKMNLDKLSFGHSSKVTMNFRVKDSGRVRFKYLAHSDIGNNLTFHINSQLVGGSWAQSSEWKVVEFNVQGGQTYKFDWLVRKTSEKRWGNNAIYVKDIEILESIKTWQEPAPPDYDTLGSDALMDNKHHWITYTSRSIVGAHFRGHVVPDNKERILKTQKICSDRDGTVSFEFSMGVGEPDPRFVNDPFYNDEYTLNPYNVKATNGSTAESNYIDFQLTVNSADNSTYAESKLNGGLMEYNLYASKGSKLLIGGQVEVVPSIKDIDHYQETLVVSNPTYGFSGINEWSTITSGIRMDDPIQQGDGDASFNVDVPNDEGYLLFDYSHNLRSSETFQVLIDGVNSHNTVYSSNGTQVRIPLSKGSHSVSFRVNDSITDPPTESTVGRSFTYGENSDYNTYRISSPLGSYFDITRNADVKSDRVIFNEGGQQILVSGYLNPGASFYYSEGKSVHQPLSSNGNTSGGTEVFYDSFNVVNGFDHPSRWSMTADWEWEDIYLRFNSGDPSVVHDGVWKIEGKTGTHTATLLSPYITGGYIQFEYGGTFAEGQSLKVYVNGTLVKTVNTSTTSATGNIVTIPLPGGNNRIDWVYENLGGQTVKTEDSTSNYSSTNEKTANGEVCFTSGSHLHSLAYKYTTAGLPSKTGAPDSKMLWGGDTNTRHSVNGYHVNWTNGGTMWRELHAPGCFGSYTYKERLNIYKGSGSVATPTHMNTLAGKWSNVPRGVVKTDEFYNDLTQDVKIEFDWCAFTTVNNDGFGHRESSYKKTPRISYHVDLVGSNGYRKTLVDDNRNVGEIPTNHVGTVFDFDPSTGRKFSNTYNLAQGTYWLEVKVKDLVADHNQYVDKSTHPDMYYWYLIMTSNINISKVSHTPSDNTKVKLEVIDKSNGSIIDTLWYSSTTDISYTVPEGKKYQFKYTLQKGTSTGGYDNKGGAMELVNGTFNESWTGYCKDKHGNFYCDYLSPYTGDSGDDGTLLTSPSNSWCWFDVPRVFDNGSLDCTGVSDFLISASPTPSILTNSSSLVEVGFTNNTSSPMQFSFSITFDKQCPLHWGELFNGYFELKDVKNPPPSWVEVKNVSVHDRKAIWMGGEDTSELVYSVYRKNLDGTESIVFSESISGVGKRNLTALTLDGVSGYRTEFKIFQKGSISSVTGRDYRTTLRVRDFTVEEIWEDIPSPFNSTLALYVDGELYGSWNTPPSLQATPTPSQTVEYLVSKGCHTYEWRFIGGDSESNWDYVEIDWLRITNWVYEDYVVIPYCEPGGGDKCIEALIRCLIHMWKHKPRGCKIGKRIWLFT